MRRSAGTRSLLAAAAVLVAAAAVLVLSVQQVAASGSTQDLDATEQSESQFFNHYLGRQVFPDEENEGYTSDDVYQEPAVMPGSFPGHEIYVRPAYIHNGDYTVKELKRNFHLAQWLFRSARRVKLFGDSIIELGLEDSATFKQVEALTLDVDRIFLNTSILLGEIVAMEISYENDVATDEELEELFDRVQCTFDHRFEEVKRAVAKFNKVILTHNLPLENSDCDIYPAPHSIIAEWMNPANTLGKRSPPESDNQDIDDDNRNQDLNDYAWRSSRIINERKADNIEMEDGDEDMEMDYDEEEENPFEDGENIFGEDEDEYTSNEGDLIYDESDEDRDDFYYGLEGSESGEEDADDRLDGIDYGSSDSESEDVSEDYEDAQSSPEFFSTEEDDEEDEEDESDEDDEDDEEYDEDEDADGTYSPMMIDEGIKKLTKLNKFESRNTDKYLQKHVFTSAEDILKRIVGLNEYAKSLDPKIAYSLKSEAVTEKESIEILSNDTEYYTTASTALGYSLCNPHTQYPIQLQSLAVSPYPMVFGKPLVVDIKAKVNKRIDKGAIGEVKVTKMFFTIARLQVDACDLIKDAGLSCPLEPGEYQLSYTSGNLPSVPTSLTVGVHVTVNSSPKADKEELLCTDLKSLPVKN